MRIVTIIALLILAAMATTALADELHEDVGTTAFAFTKIGVGARPVAMGGAFVGLADDITALYYNPAGLAGLQDLAVSQEAGSESGVVEVLDRNILVDGETGGGCSRLSHQRNVF